MFDVQIASVGHFVNAISRRDACGADLQFINDLTQKLLTKYHLLLRTVSFISIIEFRSLDGWDEKAMTMVIHQTTTIYIFSTEKQFYFQRIISTHLHMQPYSESEFSWDKRLICSIPSYWVVMMNDYLSFFVRIACTLSEAQQKSMPLKFISSAFFLCLFVCNKAIFHKVIQHIWT